MRRVAIGDTSLTMHVRSLYVRDDWLAGMPLCRAQMQCLSMQCRLARRPVLRISRIRAEVWCTSHPQNATTAQPVAWDYDLVVEF